MLAPVWSMSVTKREFADRLRTTTLAAYVPLRGAFLFANAFLKASRSKLNRLFTTMFDELKASQAGVA